MTNAKLKSNELPQHPHSCREMGPNEDEVFVAYRQEHGVEAVAHRHLLKVGSDAILNVGVVVHIWYEDFGLVFVYEFYFGLVINYFVFVYLN